MRSAADRSTLLRERDPRDSLCPLCRDRLGDDPVARCEACETALHPACADELGGCPTLGCAGRGALEAAPSSGGSPAWTLLLVAVVSVALLGLVGLVGWLASTLR